MNNTIGWIGVGLMVLGYSFLNTKKANMFLLLNAISCVLLFIHALKIGDYVFVVVNLFAAAVLSKKYLKGGIK